MSIATVIGPTPPGTGVIARARLEADSNSTSPTSLPLSKRLIPTSTTTAPSRTMSPLMTWGRPAATHSTSARRGWAGRRRGEPSGSPSQRVAQVRRVEAVHVLLGRDRGNRLVLVAPPGEGELEQDAVDGGVGVQPPEERGGI